MKRLLIIFTAFLMSCEAENPQPNEPTQCDCYEQHEQQVAGGNWIGDYNTTAQPDLCSKETGEYIYPTMMTRYKIVCN